MLYKQARVLVFQILRGAAEKQQLLVNLYTLDFFFQDVFASYVIKIIIEFFRFEQLGLFNIYVILEKKPV